MGFTPITVRVGDGLQYATGDRARGRVKLTPTAPMRNGATVVASPVVQEIGRDGTLPLPVAATDDPDTLPTGVTYLADLTIPGQAPRSFYVVIPHTAPGGIVDLTEVDELTIPPAVVAPLRRIRDASDYDDTVAPQFGQVIAWNGTSWAPADGGSGGGSGFASSLILSRVAGSSSLSGHRLVVPTGASAVDYADNATASHRGAPLWLTLGAAAADAPVQVLARGPVTEPSWFWTRGPLFLGTNGHLTQTVPTATSGEDGADAALFLTVAGFATSATSAFLDPQPPITLI